MMKRILFLFSLVFLLNACSLEDDSINYHYEILPVDSFELPETFTFGETYALKIYLKDPLPVMVLIVFILKVI